MIVHPRNSHDLIVAGIKRGMLIVNTEKGIITEFLDNDCEDVTILRFLRHGRSLLCGTANGEIRIHDPMEPSCPPIYRMQAHSGAITDLTVCSGSILTCGYQLRYGNYSLESMVRVFDVRTLRPLIPIHFGAGPAFLKSHPKMTTSAMMLSQSGQLQTIDVGNPADIKLRQLSAMSFLTAFDISSSGDALVYCDAENNIHLWSVSLDLEPRFSNLPNQTVFADFQEEAESCDMVNDPFHKIGMPYYREELFSSWPATMVFEVGKPSAKIDSDILQNMKIIDGVGYAPFHKRRRRNLAEESALHAGTFDTPRFRSEKAKAIASGEPRSGMVDNIFEDMGRMSLGTMHIPNYYGRMEIKYSKFGIEDFDFEYYNHTEFSGLETSFANSYCNSLLQLYHFSGPISRAACAHAGSSCLRENCLLCEAGYLFSMLRDAHGQNCQSSNFLRAFSENEEAKALGLILIDSNTPPQIPWSNLTQSFNRFLLETLTREAVLVQPTQNESEVAQKRSELDSVVGIYSKVISKCSCGFETIKPEISVVTDLVYTKPVVSRKDNQTTQFSTILRTSIHREGPVRGWCQACRQFQPASIRRLVHSLPQVMNINAMVQDPEQWRHWAGRAWPPSRIGVILVSGKLQILQGRDLEKRISDNRVQQYILRGTVNEVRIDQNEAHMVSFVRLSESEDSNWLLFNDFLVRQVTAEEALSYPGPWKVPAVLSYEKLKDFTSRTSTKEASPLDLSVINNAYSLIHSPVMATDFEVLSQAERVAAGTLVAIDAEFVALQQEEIEFRSDGTRHTIQPSRLSLARVSVLRGEGRHVGKPFIDDYIATRQPIVNYLTEFSGIHEGDLDPERSRHNLVPHKYAYRKLYALVRAGCVFIGHGLRSDFRIINLNLPKEQVIDTVDLFYLPERQRKLSLKFLAWFFLEEQIQQAEHDSIEDARTALLLYQKYLEFQSAGIFEMRLQEVYEEGRSLNYRVPAQKDT